MSLVPALHAPAAVTLPATTSVDVIVPVFNEQGALPGSIRRLHDFLSSELPFDWRIVIADNASTDETRRVVKIWPQRSRARSTTGSSRTGSTATRGCAPRF